MTFHSIMSSKVGIYNHNIYDKWFTCSVLFRWKQFILDSNVPSKSPFNEIQNDYKIQFKLYLCSLKNQNLVKMSDDMNTSIYKKGNSLLCKTKRTSIRIWGFY